MAWDFNTMFLEREEGVRQQKAVHAHEPSWNSLKDANKFHPEKKHARKRQKTARKLNRKRR